MTITLIVARGANGVIGREGALPWRLADDMAFFKAVTIGKPILMGRKTWASIGRPLPGRPNLVVTRDVEFAAKGTWIFPSLDVALQAARAMARLLPTAGGEVCIIGGAEIYAQTLPLAHRLHVTDVDAQPTGDAFFPNVDATDWVQTAARYHAASTVNEHAFTIRTLERTAYKGTGQG